MLSKRIGSETMHVPYKGADALNDLLAGPLQFMFATIPSVIQHIQAGKLRAIAVTQREALALAARRADRRREGLPGLRGRLVVRLLRAQGHAAADHRVR